MRSLDEIYDLALCLHRTVCCSPTVACIRTQPMCSNTSQLSQPTIQYSQESHPSGTAMCVDDYWGQTLRADVQLQQDFNLLKLSISADYSRLSAVVLLKTGVISLLFLHEQSGRMPTTFFLIVIHTFHPVQVLLFNSIVSSKTPPKKKNRGMKKWGESQFSRKTNHSRCNHLRCFFA